MYSIVTMDKTTSDETHEEQKAKGIPKKALIERRHDSFVRALFEHEREDVKFLKLVSKKHTVTLERQKKKGLNAFNDKVYQLDAFESRPLGHYENEGYVKITTKSPLTCVIPGNCTHSQGGASSSSGPDVLTDCGDDPFAHMYEDL